MFLRLLGCKGWESVGKTHVHIFFCSSCRCHIEINGNIRRKRFPIFSVDHLAEINLLCFFYVHEISPNEFRSYKSHLRQFIVTGVGPASALPSKTWPNRFRRLWIARGCCIEECVWSQNRTLHSVACNSPGERFIYFFMAWLQEKKLFMKWNESHPKKLKGGHRRVFFSLIGAE